MNLYTAILYLPKYVLNNEQFYYNYVSAIATCCILTGTEISFAELNSLFDEYVPEGKQSTVMPTKVNFLFCHNVE